MSKISLKSNSISTIIRSYKPAVTKNCNRLKIDFEWQFRYHDLIIKDEYALQNISEYIKENPINWDIDKLK